MHRELCGKERKELARKLSGMSEVQFHRSQCCLIMRVYESWLLSGGRSAHDLEAC